ncbi:MAG: carbon starvation protein A, partial [Alteromonadaceae bacterium]|nr:carbon starvation protein A [Alteromonadaceae bacterium]
LVVTVMLVRLGRPMWYTLAPLIFLMVMTVLALFAQLKSFYEAENYFLLGLDIVVLIASILVAMECAAALKRVRQEKADATS